MGFWHTGYIEFHEEVGKTWSREPLPPTVFPCPDCGREFLSREDLEIHRFDGHVFSRPVLLLRGRECSRSRLVVAEPTVGDNWATVDCQSVMINGVPTDPADIGAVLSQYDRGVVSVVLHGVRTEQDLELRFSVADAAELDAVDERLHAMAGQHQLTIDAIEGFLAGTEHLRTAVDYRAGISVYLYGVLARERSPESALDHDDYLERFDEAVSLLGGFDRPPANVICGLVAFHYNQFQRAIARTASARIAAASLRLLRLLHGEALAEEEIVAPQRFGLDFALSDALTEQVLNWCCIPLDGTATAAVAEMEDSLPIQEPFDRLKLRIIAAEHHLRSGNSDAGQAHVDELRHNPAAETWAQSYLSRSSRGRVSGE